MELPYTRGFDFLFILDVDLEYVYDSSFDLPWASGIDSNQYSQTRIDIDFFPVANY